MLLKLYFQTVFIFAKYFPIVTLPLYVVGAWAFSALLFYMAWDMGYGVDDNGNNQKHIMTEQNHDKIKLWHNKSMTEYSHGRIKPCENKDMTQ